MRNRKVIKHSEKQDILDSPTENGLLLDRLIQADHNGICADIKSRLSFFSGSSAKRPAGTDAQVPTQMERRKGLKTAQPAVSKQHFIQPAAYPCFQKKEALSYRATRQKQTL